jgi:hypothetical protein
MPQLVTWYAAIPIAKRDDGRFTCDYTQAIECRCADEAAEIAAVIARKPGYTAVVFADRRSPYGAT